MKPKSASIALTSIVLCLFHANAADITWDNDAAAGIQGGAGNWNTTTDTNWTPDGGTTRLVWNNVTGASNTAVLGTTGGAVAVAGTINLQGVKVTSGGYTVSGGTLNFGSALGSFDTLALGTTGANVFTVGSPLTGTGGLTIASHGNLAASGGGSGARLDITGNNTGLTGGIAITAGIVQFGSQSSAGSNAIALSNASGLVATGTVLVLNNNISFGTGGGTLRTYGSSNLFLTGTISGPGGFNRTDGGLIELTGPNTFTGKVAAQAGTLAATSFNNVVGGSTTSALGAPTTVADGTIDIGGSGQPTLMYLGNGESSDRVINFTTGSGGIVTQNGTGTLNLTSDLTGTTAAMAVVINGGGIGTMKGMLNTTALLNFVKQGPGNWKVNGNLQLNGGNLRPQGGILDFTSTSSTTGDVFIASTPPNRSNGGVLRIATGSSVKTADANTNGILGGWATVDNNTWAVSNGTGMAISGLVSLTNDTWAAGTNTNVTPGGADPASGSTTNSLRFNTAGAKTLTLAGINTVTSGGVLITPAVGGSALSVVGGTLAISNFTNNGGLSGATAGDLLIHQNNTGDLTVNSILANIIPAARVGDFAITQKVVTGLSSTSDLVVGMTVTGTGIAAGSTIASINSATQITLNNNTVAAGAAASLTFGGTANGLTKTGAGPLVLNGANTYSGTTRVFEGKLTVNANNGGKIYEVASAATLELGYGTSTTAGGYGVTIYGAGTAATTGLYLKGGTFVTLTSTLRLAGSPTTIRTYGAGIATLVGWDSNPTYLQVDATASGSIIDSNIQIQTTNYGYRINTAPGLFTATGDVTINGPLTGDRMYIKVGYGSAKFTGAGTSNTQFDVRQGSIILSGADNRLASGANVNLGNGTDSGTLVLDGISQTLTGLTIAGTGAKNSVVGGSATLSTLVVNNSAASTLGVILGGSGANQNNLALVKNNIGVLSITGTNTFTGGTTISAGTLSLGSPGALGVSGTVSLNGGTLQFTAANTTDYTVGGRLKIQDGVTGLLDTNGQDVTIANPIAYGISGNGGLTKTGAGALILDYSTSNVSKLSDSATLGLAGGKLRLAGGSHQEIVGDTLVTGNSTIERISGSATINLGVINRTGSATLDIATDGIVRTSLVNDISGKLPTWITVNGSPASNDGSGNIVTYAGFVNVVRLGGIISSNPVANVRIVDGGSSGNVTLQAPGLTDIATLLQNATAGPAVVSILGSRILRFGATGSIIVPSGAGKLTIQNGYLTAGGADDTNGEIAINPVADVTITSEIDDNGFGLVSLVKLGSAALELAQINYYSGGTSLNAGELRLGNDRALGFGPLTINGGSLTNSSGVPLDVIDSIPQTWNANVNFNGPNNLTFTSGNVTLTANQTTTVTNGALTIAGNMNGAYTLTKAGAGILSLGGGNWNGLTTVTGGTLEVLGKSADTPYIVNSGTTLMLGYTTGGGYANTNLKVYGDGIAATTGLYFKAGANYNSSGTIELLAAPTTIRQYGSGLASIGTFDNNGTGLRTVAASSGSVIDSNIDLVSRGYGMSVDVAVGSATATGDHVVNGPLNVGSGGFFKRGAGSVTLNGTATAGNLGVRILGGSVIAGVAECLGANAALQINTGSKLNVNGNHQTVASLSFDNLPQANGTWGSTTSSATNKNDTFFSGTGVVQVGALPGGYSSWAATNAPSGTPQDDYDGDGVSNGVEYVLGGSKDTNDLDKLPKLSPSGTDLVFTFVRDQQSIDATTALTIETGTNLVTWPNSYSVPNTAAVANPGVTVTKGVPAAGKDTIVLTVPRAPDAKKFARLNVVITP